MPRRRGIKGEATQGEHPTWEPLVDAVGERVARDFMWMFEVELSDGRSLQAYKHVDTRRYVHLAADGQAYFYEPPDRHVPIPAWAEARPGPEAGPGAEATPGAEAAA